MLEVQIVDTNDFTKKFRRRKSDEMSQGVYVMEAADASGCTADCFLEEYQSKTIKVHEVTRYGTEQKTDEQVMVQ